MEKIIIYFISFILAFNPTMLYSKNISIKEKTKFNQFIKCSDYYEDFNDFSDCVDQQSFTSLDIGKLKYKKKREIFEIISIVNIINESVNEEFINDIEAFNNWNLFLNSSYKKKSSKKKLDKILDDSNCKNLNNYNEFISCFNNEFRTYDIYKGTNIKTKERMEYIVFNSLILTKPESRVGTLKKEDIWGLQETERVYSTGEGYDFFFNLMNVLGTKYFKKIKNKSDINWKKVITFIVIAILIAYLAKSYLKKSSVSNSQVSTSPTTGAVNPVNNPRGYYNLQPVKYSYKYKIRYYKPYIDLTQKSWWKDAMKARFGF